MLDRTDRDFGGGLRPLLAFGLPPEQTLYSGLRIPVVLFWKTCLVSPPEFTILAAVRCLTVPWSLLVLYCDAVVGPQTNSACDGPCRISTRAFIAFVQHHRARRRIEATGIMPNDGTVLPPRLSLRVDYADCVCRL